MADKTKFIEFLLSSEALRFGDFVTKSGRKTPYFINTGQFRTGNLISELGGFYAQHIVDQGLSDINVVFGPAYKGIPLAVATASALANTYGHDVGFTFDRKEAKDHGDGGSFVGAPISNGTKLVIVEDVITAGSTLQHIVPILRGLGDITIAGVIIAVDRGERGKGELSAIAEVSSELGIRILPLISVHDIVFYLKSSKKWPADLSQKMESYLREYGARA